jgi:malate synthase
VSPTPADLEKRWVDITGPVERKMMINALNSGADVFMADFEDSLSPTWTNVIEGQANLVDAVRRRLAFTSQGMRTVNDTVRRPRPAAGQHLPGAVAVDGEPSPPPLFYSAPTLPAHRGAARSADGPYFYLPRWRPRGRSGTRSSARPEALGIPRAVPGHGADRDVPRGLGEEILFRAA